MDRRAYRNKILAYFMPRVLLKFRLVFTNVLKVLRKKETVREREKGGDRDRDRRKREREWSGKSDFNLCKFGKKSFNILLVTISDYFYLPFLKINMTL